MDEVDFDLKQHDFLRADIQAAESESRALERHSIIALAVLWTWTAKEAPNLGALIGIISAAIGLLGGLRSWALWNHMAVKGDYVAHMESLFSRRELGGWERYFRHVLNQQTTIPKEPAKRPWYRSPGMIGKTSAAFWVLIIGLSLPFGFLIKDRFGGKPKDERAVVRVDCGPSH